ncbi:MAG: DegT/DnrJ/EryC1/StrS family aminotransferase, partial [Burkholderiales bacterium]|nr:DegT/DnrJ/EryC1/StrS family aminotransferase [Burkholderiales bacterium]
NANTKAIAVVHYLGNPVRMDVVSNLARERGLFLLEDCALAPGAKFEGKHVGLHGDAGVYSFYPVKHITTAEGGMITVKNEQLADRLRILKAFGVDRSHGERSIPGMYDVLELGFNYRMSELHAAIGIEQLKKLDLFLASRRNNHQRLSSMLENLPGANVINQPFNSRSKSSHYCLAVILDKAIADKRPQIMSLLGEKGVGTSIYYPQPVPRMKYYRSKYGYSSSMFENAASLSDQMIALPVGPHLSLTDMDFISEAITQVWKELNV